jgi:hypothetical protein
MIASADARGIFLIWNLATGETIHYFSTNAKGAYSLPRFKTKLLYSAFIQDRTVFLESLDTKTQEKTKRIECILIDNTANSTTNYPTILSHYKMQNRSKSERDNLIMLGPHFFHFSENGKYYTICQKNQKTVRIMNEEKRECIAKIDLPFVVLNIAFTSDMNLIAVSNG